MKHSGVLAILCLFFFPSHVQPQQPTDWADSILQQIEENAVFQAGRNQALIHRLSDSASLHPRNTRLQTYVLYAKIANSYPQGKSDTLLNREIRKAIAILPDKAVFEKALLHLSLAMNHAASSWYTQAFHESLAALELFHRNQNPHFESKTRLLLGNICIYIHAYTMAGQYLSQSLQQVAPKSFDYYQTVITLSKNEFYANRIDTAIKLLLPVVQELESKRDSGLLTISYLNLSAFYFKNADIDSSGTYLQKALKLSGKLDNNRIKFILYQNLGAFYIFQGETRKAFHPVFQAKGIATQDNNIEQLSYALYNLGLLYQQTGQTDSALTYMLRYIDLSNEIARHSGAIDAYQSYVSVLLENSENKLTIAQQDIQLKNRRLSLLALFTTLIIITAALVFTLFWHKKRQQSLLKDMEKKELEHRLEHEQHLKQLQTKRHKENLEAKAREIAAYSLLVSSKNQILQQIADIAKRLPASRPEASEIQNIIKNNINTDKDWEDFMIHFQKIHPGFFRRLKAKRTAGDLTENELRLCAYFRIGMSTKQIAQVLNVSPESVRMHRYRLKKKLMLAEEDSLDDFIRNV